MDRFHCLAGPAAILGAGIIVAATLAGLFRFEVVISGGMARMDRWTGRIQTCRANSLGAWDCSEEKPPAPTPCDALDGDAWVNCVANPSPLAGTQKPRR